VRIALLWTVACLLAAEIASAEETRPNCASPEQAAQVRAFYAGKEAPPAPLMAARDIKLPEEIIASALPPDRALGVAGTHFPTVWSSLVEWEKATLIMIKSGQVLEVHGPVHKGEPSQKSKFFNLDSEGAGASGHLRPDLVRSIYALSLPGKDGGSILGVAFYDASGDSAFGVYIPGEGGPVSDTSRAQFKKTWDQIAALPRYCPPAR
jgi:putative heme iron utilization protein